MHCVFPAFSLNYAARNCAAPARNVFSDTRAYAGAGRGRPEPRRARGSGGCLLQRASQRVHHGAHLPWARARLGGKARAGGGGCSGGRDARHCGSASADDHPRRRLPRAAVHAHAHRVHSFMLGHFIAWWRARRACCGPGMCCRGPTSTAVRGRGRTGLRWRRARWQSPPSRSSALAPPPPPLGDDYPCRPSDVGAPVRARAGGACG